MDRVRLGVLGGTFDPPHIGHLVLAEEARWRLALERVLWVPAGDPWRKEGKAISPAADRLAMSRLTIEGDPNFGLSTIEVERKGPSYTVETLAALQEQEPDAELFFILGEDALHDLPNWRDPAGIARLAWLAVAPREWSEAEAASLERMAPGIVNRIVPVPMPGIDVSATDLRRRVAAGESIRYLVPPAVEAYIRDHGLYRA